MEQHELKRDLIAEYGEWAENRYNPGHCLGGDVHPSVRNLPPTNDVEWFGLTDTGALHRFHYGTEIGVKGDVAVWPLLDDVAVTEAV